MIQQIVTKNAPKAIGPYSQAVLVNDFVFVSGMLPIDVNTGEIVGETAEHQTQQIMKNIISLLSAINLTLEDVVKTTIFLDSIEFFQDVNKVYGSFFSIHKPARSCVEVSAIPKGALVEIEVMAKVK